MKSCISLTAFYGPKHNEPIWEKIVSFQKTLKIIIGENYQPYTPEQIHGTVIGLERIKYLNEWINLNYKEIEHCKVKTDLALLIGYLSNTALLPVNIQVGGYKSNIDYGFVSRSESPYARSFSIQNNNVVMMGWPYKSGRYTQQLNTLRRECNRFGFLHKYHTHPEAVDNDFYFVLGSLQKQMKDQEKRSISMSMAEELSAWKNINVVLGTDDLRIVKYNDTAFQHAQYWKINNIPERLF